MLRDYFTSATRVTSTWGFIMQDKPLIHKQFCGDHFTWPVTALATVISPQPLLFMWLHTHPANPSSFRIPAGHWILTPNSSEALCHRLAHPRHIQAPASLKNPFLIPAKIEKQMEFRLLMFTLRIIHEFFLRLQYHWTYFLMGSDMEKKAPKRKSFS